MHRLQNSADASNVTVDLSVAQELGGQIRVQTGLHICRRINPQRRIEQHMVEQLPRQKRETKELTLAVFFTVLATSRQRACSKNNNQAKIRTKNNRNTKT